MEHMTPQDLFVIICITLACLAGVVLWQFRDVMLHFFGALWDRYFVVAPELWSSSDLTEGEDAEIAPAATTPQNNNNGIAITTNDNNALLLQQRARDLAAMVKAGKVGETEGIKIVFGEKASSTNPRYLVARDALKKALAELEPGPRVLSADGTLEPMTRPITSGALD